MASRLSDGSIQMADGRIVYANSLIQAQDLLEILPLVTPPPAWPFVSGGGGGGGSGSGTPGARGADGAAGAPGTQGPQGTNPGVQGPQGISGSQGNQGNQGLAGTGAQGNQGNQGNTGIGFQGLQGNQGADNGGAQGNQGNQGTAGAGVQGAQGNQGLAGTGTQGNQGNQGNQGDGAQGSQGAQGGAAGGDFFDTVVRVKQYALIKASYSSATGSGAGPTGPALSNFNAQASYGAGSTFETVYNTTMEATAAHLLAGNGQVYFVMSPVVAVAEFGRIDRRPYGRVRFLFNAITTTRLWWGFFTAAPFSSDTIPANSMGFRFSSTGGDTTFQCVTSDATTPNVQDSGVTVAADTEYILEIETLQTGDVEFFINGVSVAVSTVNLPSSAANMGMPYMHGEGTGIEVTVSEMEGYSN